MMENEQWPAKCQQSVGTNLERTDDSLNNGNTDIPIDTSEIIKSAANIDDEIRKAPASQTLNTAPITISEKSKQTIEAILKEIKSLSEIERFLFYLKLPSEVSNVVDPLRQPLNPLGSRSEINKTISWIKTHLEEDPDTSLPKQEVYDEYHRFCEESRFKPLSQADFGKAMKQVYPNVRARRLGTRGNSRYCYSGLRRCLSLKRPLLPDLSEKPLSTEVPFTQNSYQTAWLIVKEWAKQQLGKEFPSINNLAVHLVQNFSVCAGTDVANRITQADSQLTDTSGKINNQHREMQIQLQRKIHQKNENKERKRKMQSPKSDYKTTGGKKCRGAAGAASSSSETSPMLAVSRVGSEGGSASTSPTQCKPVCDKSLDYTQIPSLPDFNSFQKPIVEKSPGRKMDAAAGGCVGGKIAIAKLPRTAAKKAAAVAAAAAAAVKQAKYKAIQPKIEQCDNAAYNRQADDDVGAGDNRSQHDDDDAATRDSFKDKKIINTISEDDCDGSDFPLPRERLNSISNVEKDAMDEYLGTNNSQHDEELSKYFSNNNIQQQEAATTNTKLTHIRQLLEQNGIVDNKPHNNPADKADVLQEDIKFASVLINNQQQQQHQPMMCVGTGYVNTLPPSAVIAQERRRVSFDMAVHEEAVPPSPNTRRKHFSFTPISDGPQSPNGGLHSSKCSSTNASPFVSPRNTPIPRTKNSTHQNAGIMLECRKPVKIKKELTLDLPDNAKFISGTSCNAMSAPPSPLLLQRLLNRNNKVTYNPGYVHQQGGSNLQQTDTSLEVSELLANQIQQNNMGYRSQSVPVNHMMSMKNNYGLERQNLMNALNKQQNDFNEIDPIPESESNNVKQLIETLEEGTTPCDNNNIDMLCNIDLTSGNQCLPQYGLVMSNDTLEFNDEMTFNNQQLQHCARNMNRSQSLDVSSFETKCNPSRSVPNTPLPFTHNIKPIAIKTFTSSSRSYPSTPLNSMDSFTYQLNGDCLLNGQPIRNDALPLNFIADYTDMNGGGGGGGGTDGVIELPDNKTYEYAVPENDGSLIDDNCVLIEPNYNSNLN